MDRARARPLQPKRRRKASTPVTTTTPSLTRAYGVHVAALVDLHGMGFDTAEVLALRDRATPLPTSTQETAPTPRHPDPRL